MKALLRGKLECWISAVCHPSHPGTPGPIFVAAEVTRRILSSPHARRLLRVVEVWDELNMVRCGVVRHPSEWGWSSYGQWMGWWKRNRVLDVEMLLWLLESSSVAGFRQHLNADLEKALLHDELEQQAQSTEAIAARDRAFVEAMRHQMNFRQEMMMVEQGGSWLGREE